MRIWRLDELGDPIDKLHLDDIDPPSPRAGQVLIDIDAVGLAFPDVLQCQGRYQVPTRTPFTPGGEFAGRISAVGEGVDPDRVGAHVMVLAGNGLAEQVAVDADRAFAYPEQLEAAKMAAIPINYGTTMFALNERAGLQAGETLLVTGAAGGVGSSAIQLGKAAGARVIAIAGGGRKIEIARQLGADEVIDHRETPEFVDTVRELTDGKGVDVCYEAVGGDTFKQCQRCMAWDGRLLVIGFVAGIPEIKTNHILLKNYSIVGVHWGAWLMRSPDALATQAAKLIDMAAAGAIDPLLYPPFAIEQAAEALQLINDRGVWGKAVVRV